VETFSRGTLDPWYVTGLIDGIGTFTYSRSGRQIALYFAVKTASERGLLTELAAFFQAGTIYEVRGSSYLRVQHRSELPKIVDHFDRYPLRSSKHAVFLIWREMVAVKQEFRRPDRDRLAALANELTALRA
jgi:LAGLIDADG endonuclease